MEVEVIFQSEYAHKPAIRTLLRDALSELGLMAVWQEWEAGSASVPSGLKKHSNVLVVKGKVLWELPESEKEFPDQKTLSSWMEKGQILRPKSRWRTFTGITLKWLLGFGIALFPKCPICWAAYMNAFGVFGLEELPYMPWILPVMIGLLAINAIMLLRGAKKRNGYGPFYLSVLGFALLLVGKLVFELDVMLYTGIALIISGSIWNALPRKVVDSIGFWLNPRSAKWSRT